MRASDIAAAATTSADARSDDTGMRVGRCSLLDQPYGELRC